MGARGSSGGAHGGAEPKGRRMSLTNFLKNLKENNTTGMIKELGKQNMEVSDAVFTVNGNAVKSQYAEVTKGEDRVSVRFLNEWNPIQVAKPTTPIRTKIEVVTYKNGTPTAIRTLEEKKSTSLKNAAKNYEAVLDMWKQLTRQKIIRFK